MLYDYVCDVCGATETVKRPMADPDVAPICWIAYAVSTTDPSAQVTMAPHGRMRRLYQGQSRSIVYLGAADYVMKAYRGEELPAGMTQAQVRGIVHGATDHKLRGRANARKYKTLR